MPMPVSVIAIATIDGVSAFVTRIVTEPSRVNFSALLRRLSTTCFTFWRSLKRGPRSGDTWLVTLSFERAMIGSISASTSSTSCLRMKVEIWSGIRPASIRDRSRISLMMPTRCRPFDAIRSRAFRWLGVRSPEMPCSRMLA